MTAVLLRLSIASFTADSHRLTTLKLLGFPIPAWIALAAYVLGWLVLQKLPVGRHILAIGDGEATAGLMGLKVERALAGVILASQFGAGQPAEGVGWELFAIASVVVGGTLL